MYVYIFVWYNPPAQIVQSLTISFTIQLRETNRIVDPPTCTICETISIAVIDRSIATDKMHARLKGSTRAL